MRQVHGGDIVTFQEQYGREPLDFSANTNPLGMSPKAKTAICEAVHTADRYPDSQCRALRQAIGAFEEVPPEYILCGNGASDLICRLALALRPRTALIEAPTFVEYEPALAKVGCQVAHHVLSPADDYRLTYAILEKITPELDILFLCEPNNPTGLSSPPGLLQAIVGKCGETGTRLVVDECFSGFLPEPDRQSVKPFLEGLPGLFILRAFTKLYGLAGVRLGYLLSCDIVQLEAINKWGPPWPVSSLAQAAGIASLEDVAFVEQTRELVSSERLHMYEALGRLGLQVQDGQANYLFFHSEHTELHTQLAQRGILIRDCSGYKGLGVGNYRVAIRLPEENERLVAALDEILRS